MTRVIAVSNAKGGVGKTVTVANLGAALAELDRKVLLVDFDSQGSLTLHFGYQPESLRGRTIYEVIKGNRSARGVIQVTEHGVDLIPANIDLAAAEVELLTAFHARGVPWYDRLARALGDGLGYDYILVDCPPSLGVLTMNAYVAATEIIVPLACDYLSMRGLGQLLTALRSVKNTWNGELKVLGVLPTLFDSRTLHSREALEETRRVLQGKLHVYDHVVKRSVKFKEAPVVGQPITAYAPSFEGAEAYRALAREVDAS
mgnify:CR=1 FL=1